MDFNKIKDEYEILISKDIKKSDEFKFKYEIINTPIICSKYIGKEDRSDMYDLNVICNSEFVNVTTEKFLTIQEINEKFNNHFLLVYLLAFFQKTNFFILRYIDCGEISEEMKSK